MFGSPHSSALADYDFYGDEYVTVKEVLAPQSQMPKELVFIPALIFLAFIFMLQRSRERFSGQLNEAQDLKLLTLEAKIARSENDTETAVTALNQIIDRDALNGEALIELGNIYAAQDDLPKAINRFEQAEKIEAFERQSLIAHAQALVSNTDYTTALPLLRRALKMESDNNLEDYVKRVERAARDKG